MKKNRLIIISAVLLISLVTVISEGTKIQDASLTFNDTRLLVIAPHPDDETLSSAVSIKKVLEAGGVVNVVFMTNGDGYKEAAQTFFEKKILSSSDYLSFGATRQQEALNALSKLNLSRDAIIFLGYPDEGMMSLFEDNWSIQRPYTSKFTETDHNLYENAYEQGTYYCGENVLYNLKKILETFEPTMIIYPDVQDDNKDHKATNFFVKKTLEEMEYDIVELTYMVHYKSWPIMINGSIVATNMLEPNALIDDENEWIKLPVTPDERNLAVSMLSCHKTQLDAMYRLNMVFLFSFIRGNELFKLA